MTETPLARPAVPAGRHAHAVVAQPYSLGYTEPEIERLDAQAASIAAATELLLRRADVAPGMRVLDLGTGLGHVAFQLAELVGPTGEVVAIDQAVALLEIAEKRRATARVHNVQFLEADVRAFRDRAEFDAVVGRLILFHLPDPVDVLRHHAGALRPGGLAVVVDFDLGTVRAEPPVPLVDTAADWVMRAFRQAGANPVIGSQLGLLLREAGLAAIDSFGVQAYLAHDDPNGAALLAGVVNSLAPTIVSAGIATEDELGLGTLRQRLDDAIRASAAVVLPPGVVGAWGRVAGARHLPSERSTPSATIDANSVYSLGQSGGESQRLRRQADELAPESIELIDRARLRPGDRAIDLGCGPRGVLDLLADRVSPGGRVLGLDADAAMIAMASQFVADHGLDGVELVCADARDTGLPSDTFDLVHARTLLCNVPQPEQVLAEMVRLARPGACVASLEPDTEYVVCHPPDAAFKRLCEIFKLVFVRNGADPHIGRRVAELYRQAGLQDVTVEVRAGMYPVGHSRRTIRADLVRAMRPQVLSMGIADEQELDRLDAAARRHLGDPNTLVMPSLNFLVWGRKPVGQA